ncbi:Uncharacterised protein [Legionella quateirensis]|uniref:Uncharacterized protein n=1 Tax=Legionella quateirensis TaxID=45072 RepID=A0A378L486_9GAMM|nr:hypothetical protein Lqua_2384 [Legionella quateirensis]STY18950.1 Uncharacterised protein [Legionella quateirensis]
MHSDYDFILLSVHHSVDRKTYLIGTAFLDVLSALLQSFRYMLVSINHNRH